MALLSGADGGRSACERQKCREHSVSPPWRPHLPALHVCAHCRFRSLHSLAVFRVSGSASTESGRVRRPYRPDQCSPDDYLVANSEIFALAVPATCVWSEPCLCTWGDGTTSHRSVLAAAGASLPPPVRSECAYGPSRVARPPQAFLSIYAYIHVLPKRVLPAIPFLV